MRRSPFAILLWAATAVAQQNVSLSPPIDLFYGAAFDSLRGRLVAFDRAGETWELDGTTLLHRSHGAVTPPGRGMPALVYDAARRHVLMFGGRRDGNLLNDTWTWDGVTWRQLPATGPAAGAPPMTFDSQRNLVVLVQWPATWEHNGTQWLPRLTATPPPFFGPKRLCFDSTRGVSVMWSDDANAGRMMSEYNGTRWSVVSAAGQPAPQQPESIAYDPLRARVVAVGAGHVFSPLSSNEVWEWDGRTWTQVASTPPTQPLMSTNWFDPRLGMVMNAAAVIQPLSADLELRAWNGTTMTTSPVQSLPRQRATPAILGCLPHLTLFGGLAGDSSYGFAYSNDTWLWRNDHWEQASPTTSPPPRAAVARASRLTSGFIFGGSAPQDLGDFWEWNGSQWTQLPGGPSPRGHASMAADLLGSNVLLFGGFSAFSQLGDTWLWNGTNWGPVTPPVSPPARGGAAMAWSVHTNTVLLFGGASFTGILNDTWEWNGVTWRQRITPTVPPAFTTCSMMEDPRLTGMLLEGTIDLPASGSPQTQLWSFQGTDWVQIGLQTDNAPRAAWSGIDWATFQVLTTDGATVREWTTTPASTAVYGNGCGSPAPRVALRSRLRAGTVSGLEFWGPPASPCAFVVDGAQASIALGNGCTQLLVGASLVWFKVTDAHGQAAEPVAVPSALIGVPMFLQGLILDPAAPGGFSASAGVRMEIGH